jgi:hypothetical protein
VDLNISAKGTGSVNIGGNMTIADGQNIVLDTTTGTKFGTATTQKLSFYNKAPIVQPASATQAAVISEGLNDAAESTYTQADMTKVQTELNDVTVLANEMRTVLVSLGLMKGSA